MISSSGIASGIDTNSLVKQLISIERQPITQLQTKQSTIRSQVSELGKFASQLGELEDLIEELGSSSALLANSVTSSDEEVIMASADGDATSGRWEVEVSKLARKERNSSTSFTDSTSEVREGTLTLEVWGEDAVEVEIAAGATLEQVRDAINASGAQVDASILNTGSGSQLQLTSKKSGNHPTATAGGEDSELIDAAALGAGYDPDAAVVLTESYTGGGGQELGLVQTQQAQNAEFSIDGVQMVAASNSITSALDGITLELEAETTEPIEIEVAADTEQVAENVQGLLDKYNQLQGTLDRLGKENPSFARNAQRALSDAFSRVENPDSQAYVNLSAIGVSTDHNSGQLKLDKTELLDALKAEPEAVTSLFLREDEGVMEKLSGMIEIYTKTYDGVIEGSKKSLTSRIDLIDTQIERKERRLEARESLMRSQFSAMESFISEMNNLSMRMSSFMPQQS